MVADLDTERARSVVGDTAKVVGDAREIIANPEIDVVIELIGGYGIAKALVLEAIAAGKHVVTANKALLAVHGSEIFKAAAEKGVMVAYEAAVAGGIDRKSTRLNSSHLVISYAVFCLKKKKENVKRINAWPLYSVVDDRSQIAIGVVGARTNGSRVLHSVRTSTGVVMTHSSADRHKQ